MMMLKVGSSHKIQNDDESFRHFSHSLGRSLSICVYVYLIFSVT